MGNFKAYCVGWLGHWVGGGSYVISNLNFTPGRYVEYDLRKQIHAHLLTLPPAFFENTIGDTMSRMINDIQALRLMSAFDFYILLTQP